MQLEQQAQGPVLEEPGLEAQIIPSPTQLRTIDSRVERLVRASFIWPALLVVLLLSIFPLLISLYLSLSRIRKIHDPELRPKLLQIEQDANRHLIDYADMSPTEREIIRRLIFFYPWVKGSTVYSGRFLGEHPAQAGITGQLGQLGYEEQQNELGNVPSWARGIVRVGGTNALPLTINPNAAAIFGTPGDVLSTLRGEPGFSAENFGTPAAQLLNALWTGRDSLGRQVGREHALAELYRSQPLYTLMQRLSEDQSRRSYPLTKREALGQFLLGSSLYPRRTNRAKLNRSAYLERHPR